MQTKAKKIIKYYQIVTAGTNKVSGEKPNCPLPLNAFI